MIDDTNKAYLNKKYAFQRSEESEEFVCSRCGQTKKSKNKAVSEDGKDVLCNGCFGLLLSKKLITR